MKTTIARLIAKENEFDNMRACALEIAAAVAANEPGNKLYAICEAGEPNTLVFVERYVDEKAIEMYRNSDHMKSLGRKIGATLAGKPEILFRLTDCT